MKKKIAFWSTFLLSTVLMMSMVSFEILELMIEGRSTPEYGPDTFCEYYEKSPGHEFDDEVTDNIHDGSGRIWYDHEKLDGNISSSSNDYHHISIGTMKPGQPGNATIDFDGMRVQIEWDPPSDNGSVDIIGYRIYKGTNNGNFTMQYEPGVDDFEYLDLNFTYDTNYSYYIVAYNQEGEGNRSAILNIRPMRPPSPPINVKIFQAANGVSISWDTPVSEEDMPIVLYRINRQEEGSSDIFWIASSKLTIYLDKNIIPNTTYHYYIFAVNDAGVSNRSERVSIDVEYLTPQKDPVIVNNDEENFPMGVMVLIVIFVIIIVSILIIRVLLKKRNLEYIPSKGERPPND